MKYYDAHVHICFDARLDDGVEMMKTNFEARGCTGATLLGLPMSSHCHNGYDATDNVKALYYREVSKDFAKVTAFAGFEGHSDDPDYYLDYAKKCVAMGFDGFKTIMGMPSQRKKINKPIYDSSFDKFFDYLSENKLPFVLHCANPIDCWDVANASPELIKAGRVYDGSYPTQEELHCEAERLLERFPKLHVTFAHFLFMGDKHDRIKKILDSYENVTLDLTPGASIFTNFSKDVKKWREFFIEYQHRIMLGSDNYIVLKDCDYPSMIKRFFLVRDFLEKDGEFHNINSDYIGLGLDESVVENICWNNAERRAQPNPVNKENVVKECKRLLGEESILAGYDKENLNKIIAEWGTK